MNTPQSFTDIQKIHDNEIHNPALAGVIYGNNPIWSFLYVGQQVQNNIAKNFLATPKKLSQYLRKNRGKTIVAGAFLAYMFSPEIGYFKNTGSRVAADEKTKKELGIDSVYHTSDWETNTIVKLVSGLASQSEIDSLVKLYGHQQAFDTLYTNTPKDTLLYKCLVNVLLSLHNPRISFDGDYNRDILGSTLGYDNTHVSAKVDEFRSGMQVYNIENRGVFGDTNKLSHKIDSLYQLAPTKATKQDMLSKEINMINKSGAKKITNNIAAELGHIRGLHRDGLIRYYINYLGNYMKNSFNQGSLYDQKGTEEYVTHATQNGRAIGEEGIVIAILVKMYEDSIPQNSKRHMQRLITFYEGYFDNYSDPTKAQLYRGHLKLLQYKK